MAHLCHHKDVDSIGRLNTSLEGILSYEPLAYDPGCVGLDRLLYDQAVCVGHVRDLEVTDDIVDLREFPDDLDPAAQNDGIIDLDRVC